jgi:hypothetical protein
MLPTHGAATSVFLLANALRYGDKPSVAAWVQAAQSGSTFLAAAIHHLPAADWLLANGLALPSPVRPTAQLRALSATADRATLLAVAALILQVSPPVWLSLAVIEGQVHREIIPTRDLDSLLWLGAELDQLLIDASRQNSARTDLIALGIGRAAELVILAGLQAAGLSPLHVSEISDRFGYDIEDTNDSRTSRWEVKGCTDRTSGSFHLSRNEYDQCRRFADEWKLIQVEFSGRAVVSDCITNEHVRSIRELPAGEVVDMTPTGLVEFEWEASCRMTPSLHRWRESSIAVPAGLLLPSLESLGREVLSKRSQSERD